MAAVGHFGCPKFTFDRISGHFRSIHNFNFLEILTKMAAVGHFGCPKFTFDRISGHFRSIRIFIFLEILTKWLPSAILDVQNSLSITFLAILDQGGIFILLEIFDKMAAVGHFWCPIFTFNRISGHIRSIQNFLFFLNFWQNNFRSHFLPFQVDTQLFLVLNFFWQNGRRWPFWMGRQCQLSRYLDE